ncbi:MAG: Tfp pilus assembly protein FimT/FimU [Pseudohongiellaceae bacterium]
MTPISAFNTAVNSAKQDQAGFTLLEILLVLTVIGMASVLVVPNLSNLDSRSFDAQQRQAISLLNYARRIAVVNSQPAAAVFVITSANDEFTSTSDQEDATAELDQLGALEPVGKWRSDGLQIRFRDSTEREVEIEEQVTVIFYPEGGSTGGTLFVSLDDREVAIEIDPFTGRITSEAVTN